MSRAQSHHGRFLESCTRLPHGILRTPAAIFTSLRNSEAGRLTLAMLLSMAIHLVPFMASLLHFSSPEAGRQIILQATLQPLPNKPVAKPIARTAPIQQKKPEEKPEPAKTDKNPDIKEIITGNSAIKIPLEEIKAQQQTPGEPNEPENHAAQLIADPGAPAYPAEAVQRKLESCVLAAVYVSTTGEVEKVTILHADEPGVFDQSVIETQTVARYLPARIGNNAIASRVLAVVSFVLEPARYRNCAMRYAAAAQKINLLPVAEAIPSSLFEEFPRGQ